MAELDNYDTSQAAEMDYPEHEKTYALFLFLIKWGIIVVLAIVIGMMVGLIMNGGFIGGILSFVVLVALAYFLT